MEQPEVILICGSRKWTNAGMIADFLKCMPRGTLVIVGALYDDKGAIRPVRGADAMAAQAARDAAFGVVYVPADFDRFGLPAGPMRNGWMLDLRPTEVWAFWDGESPGTRNTIKGARKRGITLRVFEIGKEPTLERREASA